ncbi:MAG: hypothetical protein A4E24_00904 [Methanomethylovorans sp. PtaU1.Bin093]|nr:MAG: hypothetical protein A4E24_00904 [Methanomethylovorans sp. PtaU1.Bin093]
MLKADGVPGKGTFGTLPGMGSKGLPEPEVTVC